MIDRTYSQHLVYQTSSEKVLQSVLTPLTPILISVGSMDMQAHAEQAIAREPAHDSHSTGISKHTEGVLISPYSAFHVA